MLLGPSNDQFIANNSNPYLAIFNGPPINFGFELLDLRLNIVNPFDAGVHELRGHFRRNCTLGDLGAGASTL
ncbi:MAG: hypothetical protein O3C40_18860 [Planctomycetota bacterium]|nr:hypothetical protein [Planctomycetota bacterium]